MKQNYRKALPGAGIDFFDARAAVEDIRPGAELTLLIHRRTGERVEVPVKCRLDTAEEVSVYGAGGVLQRFAQDFLEATAD
jgi:aconitate hydratase